jgi:hypothetical protein
MVRSNYRRDVDNGSGGQTGGNYRWHFRDGFRRRTGEAEKGASVIITGHDETRGASTVEKISAGGHDAEFIAADFSEMSEVGRVADASGEIDVLINCAGF